MRRTRICIKAQVAKVKKKAQAAIIPAPHSTAVNKKRIGTEKMESNNESSVQNLLLSLPYHTVFAFLIPLHIAILGVFAQGRSKNLFETHSTELLVLLLSTFIYCIALAADLKCQHHQTRYSQLFGLVAIIFGSLSSASVISIFFGHIIFTLWALVPIAVAYQHAKNAYTWLRQKIEYAVSLIKDAYNWVYPKIMKTISSSRAVGIGSKETNSMEHDGATITAAVSLEGITVNP